MLLENENQSFYCYYEELFFVYNYKFSGLIDMADYKIVLLDIGIFNNYYPSFIINNITELISIFERDSVKSNELQLIFADMLNENDNLVVSYNEYDDIYFSKSLKLIETSTTNYINHFIENKKEIEIYDTTTESVLIKHFNEIINNKYNCLILKDTGYKNCFNFYKYVTMFNFLGCNVKIEKHEIIKEQSKYYGKYLEILKRKNPDYEFKEIELYKDPFNNNEIECIDQSIIIDTIYSNILNARLNNGFRDIFVTAPTGAGKSILFQIPAILAAEQNNLVTIVISHLIGLMKDQVNNIKDMTKSAATINSEYTPYEKEEIKNRIKNGDISILYISPETLLSNSDISTFIGDRSIGLLVVDEAHTVAT